MEPPGPVLGRTGGRPAGVGRQRATAVSPMVTGPRRVLTAGLWATPGRRWPADRQTGRRGKDLTRGPTKDR